MNNLYNTDNAKTALKKCKKAEIEKIKKGFIWVLDKSEVNKTLRLVNPKNIIL